MIGKKVSNGWKTCAVFSNGWKTFFQWLENLGRFFQRLEKFFGGFPMIGKNFREATKETMGTRSAGGMRRDTNKWESSDNYDNFRQLFSTLKSMETASRTRNGWESGFWRQLGQLGTTCSRCAAQPGGERETDGKAGGTLTKRPFSSDWKSFYGNEDSFNGSVPLFPAFSLKSGARGTGGSSQG